MEFLIQVYCSVLPLYDWRGAPDWGGGFPLDLAEYLRPSGEQRYRLHTESEDRCESLARFECGDPFSFKHSKGTIMEMFFGVCAVLGGTVLLCQFVMTLIGFDSDADVDDLGGDSGGDVDGDHADGYHHGADWIFSVITFRTIVAALTFFGLAGLAANSAGTSQLATYAIATAAGLAAMYGVHWMMQGLYRLRSEGTVRIDRAVGRTGIVYLKVPGQKSGVGKVTVSLQGRTMEYQAMTAQDELPTGDRIVVVDVIGRDTVEVELATEA